MSTQKHGKAQAGGRVICPFFPQGRCRFGTKCKFIHQPSPNAGPTNTSRPRRDIPCRAWKAGACSKGDDCRFRHDVPTNAARGITDAPQSTIKTAETDVSLNMEEAQTVRETGTVHEAARETKSEQQQAPRRGRRAASTQKGKKPVSWVDLAARQPKDAANEALQEAKRAEMFKAEAAKTFQHLALGSTIVTFGAGLEIQKVVTGFDSCRIRVKNLPLDATRDEVSELFTQQGMEPCQFRIVAMKRVLGDKQEAIVALDSELGNMVAIGLDGIDFRQEKLLFEISENAAQGMGASAADYAHVLTISWREPSLCFVVEYNELCHAEAKVRELNGKICGGRRVKVEMNRMPPGRVMRQFRPNSIKINGLPPNTTDADVEIFSGSDRLRRLNIIDYLAEQAVEQVRCHVEASANGRMKRFEMVSTNRLDGIVVVRAHFDSWDIAKQVHDSTANQNFWNSKLWLRLPEPLQYTITIPSEQYQAQMKQWDSLAESAKANTTCHLRINVQDRVRIRIQGHDKKVVGSFKVRVENLAAGEKLEHWHRSFATTAGSQCLRSLLQITGAYVHSDRRLRAIKVYGEHCAIQKARTMVESEIQRLASLEQTVFLKRQCVGYFVRRGFSSLKEILGEDNVTLNISSSPCTITIRGGEEARHALDRVMEESLVDLNLNTDRGAGGDLLCPVCGDSVSSPTALACGHVYCVACARHFLASASDVKTFPLCCLGDEGKCGIPIPIPIIQKFLPSHQFDRLLEVAFTNHLEQNPREFKYCTTADCNQVYRYTSSTTLTLYCPSCFTSVCTSCHEEAHDGMSCAEKKLHKDPAEQERLNEEWAMQQGVKKCPSCNIWIEKISGCNHMSCKCGAHICWRCMGTFDHATIYQHMTEVHGGIEGGDDMPNPVDREELLAQNRLFREAQIHGGGLQFGQLRENIQPVQHRPLDVHIAEEARIREDAIRRREELLGQNRQIREAQIHGGCLRFGQLQPNIQPVQYRIFEDRIAEAARRIDDATHRREAERRIEDTRRREAAEAFQRRDAIRREEVLQLQRGQRMEDFYRQGERYRQPQERNTQEDEGGWRCVVM